MRFCDEGDFGFGWLDERDRLRRASHALAVGGDVWLIDPVAWPEAEVRARELGRPRGVLQLLDRHDRDCAETAARVGVPHYVVPTTRIEGSPFELLPVARSRFWRESALWWPEPRVLVVADALGTVGYFRAPGEAIGVHPLLRLRPPSALRRVFPEHVLTGHGAGVHADAAQELHRALATARRRLPAALWSAWRARGSSSDRARRRRRARRPRRAPAAPAGRR